MKEIAVGGSHTYPSLDQDTQWFLVLHNYRQTVCKRRRKILRKMRKEQKRMASLVQPQRESEWEDEQMHIENYYYEDEPWDILLQDSARHKHIASSTDSFHPNQKHQQQLCLKPDPSLNPSNFLAPHKLFPNLFTPFRFIRQH